MSRRKNQGSDALRSYEGARKAYRRSLNSFTASVLVAVLVLLTVTPLIGSAASGSSQVLTGPVDTRLGVPMLPIAAYRVDLNAKAMTPRSGTEVPKAETDPDGDGFFGFLNKPIPPVVKETRSAADAQLWDQGNIKEANITAYMSPGFLVLGQPQGGGSLRVFQEGDRPCYISLGSFDLDGDRTLDSQAVLNLV
ncbi:MAG: hypothetical protein Q7U75_00005, partial [Desulfobacterales bacterium]|nr:hypothetical protein [Desulfobacterales bacterium]